MMQAQVFDSFGCKLGEGPFWHPERKSLIWFDILRNRMFAKTGDLRRQYKFDEHVSACGWIDRNRLLVASETRLFQFNLRTKQQEDICALEADMPQTRSNDGRADLQGGFWIGTMGKKAEDKAGAIYRYYRGELRRLYSKVSVPNSICFAPDGTRVYFSDTESGRIMTQGLNGQGWPVGTPRVFVDLRADGFFPDGSVTDAAGNLWNAQWGASRVACYSPAGDFLRAVTFPAKHTSCPAFGSDALSTLYCTSAQQGLSADVLDLNPLNGQTFLAEIDAKGWSEPQVIL